MRGFVFLLVGTVSMMVASDLPAQEPQAIQKAAKIVRFELAIEDLGVDPAVRETALVFLGPDAIRLDSEVDEAGSPVSSMIFRRKEEGYLILFHETEEAVIYDLDEFREFTEKSDALQDRMWERLTEGRSPEETEALKKMRVSKRETARLGQVAMRAGLELEKTDESGELDGYPWRKYRELRSGTLSREFLVTPWEHLGIEGETARIFNEIASFSEEKQKISSGMSRAPEPFEHYVDLGGFPLVVRQFDGEGNLVFTTTVTAIESIEDSESLFQNPGYPEEGMADRVRTIE